MSINNYREDQSESFFHDNRWMMSNHNKQAAARTTGQEARHKPASTTLPKSLQSIIKTLPTISSKSNQEDKSKNKRAQDYSNNRIFLTVDKS